LELKWEFYLDVPFIVSPQFALRAFPSYTERSDVVRKYRESLFLFLYPKATKIKRFLFFP